MQNLMNKLTHEEAVERAQKLFASIRSRTQETEKLRYIPDDTIREIRQSGLVRTLVPARWGGHEMSWKTLAATTIEVAKADPSSGWCFALLQLHNWMVAFMPDAAQADVWGSDPDAGVASSLNPSPDMSVTRVEGGYRLSGKWGFSSGIRHSDWVIILVPVPSKDGSQGKTTHYFLVPKRDFKIHDTWYVSGLKGTGSHQIELKDAFVPDYRTMELDPWNLYGESPGGAVNSSPLYRIQLSAVMPATLASVVLGSAMGAYDEWKINYVGKGKTRTGVPVAELTHKQIQLAKLSTKLEAARALLMQSLDFVETNSPLEYKDRVRMRCNYAYSVQLCTEVMEEIFATSGAAASDEKSLLQLFWRDIHAGAQHMAFNFDWVGEIFGKLELGIPVGVEY